MVQRTLSIAQARSKLPSLVNEAARGRAVQITRRGKPVAVLVSVDAYQKLTNGKTPLWEAISRFRRENNVDRGGLTKRDLAGLRDRSAGRDVVL